MNDRLAIVTGGSGTVGQRLVRHLQDAAWQVICLSRRGSASHLGANVREIRVDLLDGAACRDTMARVKGVTHVFHAARHDFETGRPESIAANVAMLDHVVDAVLASGQPLQHVSIVQGTKYYGSNLGPFMTPTPETAPRSPEDNFYFHQQDLLARRSESANWTWSAARPHAVVDADRVLPRSIPTIIAIYATVLRELGEPLYFPGTAENFRALYQFTEAGQLARAIAWMATEPRARNQAFNVTNGDCLRWCNLWPAIARHFGMECGPVRTERLAAFMGDKRHVWQSVAARHQLRATPYDSLADWRYGDFVFAPHWDHLLSMSRARDLGFLDCVNTEVMLFTMFDRLRESRVIPPA